MLAMNPAHESVTLTRDCEAILIPDGMSALLPAGTVVYVAQALGGTVTVRANGNLFRIAGRDLDALGLEAVEAAAAIPESDGGQVHEAMVWDSMRTCYDPEIPINIVELGLIYECRIAPLAPGQGSRVDVLMTLTAPGCGMGQVLVDDVRSKIERLPNVGEVSVELTFDPPWSQEMMSEAARLQAGLY